MLPARVIITDRSFVMPQLSNSYSKDIDRFPTLKDKERQVELALQAQAGNNDARDELVTSLLRYIRKVATSIFNEDSEYAKITSDKIGNKLEVDDLINEGVEGLVKAIAGFDRSKGSDFMGYAGPCISGAIRDAIENYRRIGRNEKELPADDDKNREEKRPAQDAVVDAAAEDVANHGRVRAGSFIERES